VTVKVLKHELRTPINHIIGYSEMLIEELADGGSADRHSVEAVLAIGKELLALISSAFETIGSAESQPSPEALAALRAGVQQSVDRLLAERLEFSPLAASPSGRDVSRIIDAAARLAEFARSGAIGDAV
jgi:signal transduction histidine kinase